MKCLAYLYKTLIRAVLEYGSCVWDPSYTTSVTRLEKVQQFGAKLASGKWSVHGDSLVAALGWPLLASRRSYMKLCLCRRILEGNSLISADSFQLANETSARHMNSLQLFRPYARTNYHQSSFFVSVTKLWNSLPDNIVTLFSNSVFKRYLKYYLVV